MDSTACIQEKFKILFQKFLEPDYVMDYYYAESLINKLLMDEDPEVKALDDFSKLSDLLIESLVKLEKAHLSVRVFIVRLLAVVTKKELNFVRIYHCTYSNIWNELNSINLPEMKANLRVAYMELALSVTNHNNGMKWILARGIWKNIIKLTTNNNTIFVLRQTQKFINKFLWKLNEMGDEENIKVVFDEMLKPFLENDYLSLDSMTSDQEMADSQAVRPMCLMLLSLFDDVKKIHQQNIIISVLIDHYKIISHIFIILDRFHNHELNILLGKLVFFVIIGKCFNQKPPVKGVVYDFNELIEVGLTFFNVLSFFIRRCAAKYLLDYCSICSIVWAKVWKGWDPPKFVTTSGEKVTIQQQMTFIQLVPMLCYLKNNESKTTDEDQTGCMLSDEMLNQYVVRLLNCSCEHTLRTSYALRNMVKDIDLLPITLHSIKKLSCLKDYLDNTQANIIFQALFYVLQNYVPEDDAVEEMYDESAEKELVMTYVMGSIHALVKNFNINWQDSIEILSLYTVVYNVLSMRKNLSCKFVLTAINTITLTVKKFQPPNLSLLMETQVGSPIHNLGKLIFKKLYDLNWEVRDSALELLLVCTEISYTKFPPFQKQIIEDDLIDVAAIIAKNDHEFYVRASALKCIAAASKVHNIWESLINKHADLLESLLDIISNNQEGIVRKEAVNTLCEIYQNIKLSVAIRQTMYDHMVTTALTDFHWEVQISSLKFWKLVIETYLMEQGMLDGTFPQVTFSKETRKIVTLNTAEIQKRLLKILDKLSSIGCLTVLVKLLQDDIELEVMETAVNVSLELLNLLQTYKIKEVLNPSSIADQSQESSSVNIECHPKIKLEELPDTNMESEVMSDDVIEGILNSNDINLLASIYERQMTIETEEPQIIKPKIKLEYLVTGSNFLHHMESKDFRDIIEEKKQWKEGIRSLASLLDDVLGIYEAMNEANSVDCY